MKGCPKLTLAALVLLGILAPLVWASPRSVQAQYPPPVGSVRLVGPRLACTERTYALIAWARDINGRPAANRQVTFQVVSEPGSDATVDGAKQSVKMTNYFGIAMASLYAGSTPGNLVVSAAAEGVTSQLGILVRTCFIRPWPFPWPWPWYASASAPSSLSATASQPGLNADMNVREVPQPAQLSQVVVQEVMGLARGLLQAMALPSALAPRP